MKIIIVCVLLVLTTSKPRKLWQMDVKNALLHGEINQYIYKEQLKGFESKVHPNYMCKLRTTLYGLKQSPKA